MSDGSGTDTSGTDTSGTDTSGTDTSGTDTSGTDTSGTDTSGTDTSGTDSTSEAYAQWQKAVAGVLAKARRVDASELPENPETLLDSTTYDGITVHPLYSPLDEHAEHPLPGEFPYVRGTTATRDVNRGWAVAGRFGLGESDPAEVNRQILNGLENGVSAVWLSTGSLAPGSLAATLDGVLMDLAPTTLDAGSAVAATAAELLELIDQRRAAGDGTEDRAAIDVRLGAAPLTDRFAGKAGASVADAAALAATAITRDETVRAITVDGTVFHNAGAADAQELGAAVAAGIDYIRILTESGMTAARALGQIEFRLAATDGQFDTIAKFRAARRTWARVAQVCGAPDAGAAPQHAVTSEAMMAQRDPWVNMLRTTLAAFGAGVGGADSVTVLPFDVSLPPDSLGVSRSFSNRIARNTQLLLLEESHLGRVLDPSAGSWYVEDLTEKMAESAWAVVQSIEAAGGFRAALESGSLRSDIDATRAARDGDIAHRRTALTGVNEFPNLAEKPLPTHTSEPTGVARYAAAFEALRDRSDTVLASTGARPTIFLAPLGSVAEHNVRTTFAANLLASGGIFTVNPGAVEDLGAAARESRATIAVLCGTDKRYGTDGGDAVRTLKDAGFDRVLAAGPEKAFADTAEDARPDGYLTAKIDAVAALTDLLDRLSPDLEGSRA